MLRDGIESAYNYLTDGGLTWDGMQWLEGHLRDTLVRAGGK